MGMYCCCGVKKRDGWVCECDWNGWFLCFESENIPNPPPVKCHPDKDGLYDVRVFEDGDYNETESEFCTIAKNWGEYTNQAISKWKIVYDDHYCGFRGVFAWKKKKE
jgi:hypothetical protein